MAKAVAAADKISVPFPDEPGSLYMTPVEWEQFKLKLGNECALYWCERGEEYAEENPRRFAKYKNHYRTLLNWHQRKVETGHEWFVHPQYGAGYYKTYVIDRIRNLGAF
jgi:hypothetical protein